MRVLLVTDSYWPLIGGATRSTRQLAKHLTARGHVVAVVTSWQQGSPDRDDDGGIPVFRVRDLTSRASRLSADPHRHTPPPWPDPEASVRLDRIVREFRPDLVHAYGWLSYSCAPTLVRRRVPFLLSVRDYGNICPLRTLLCHERGGGRPGVCSCLADSTRFYGRVKGTLAVLGVRSGRQLLRVTMNGEHAVSSYVAERARAHLSDGLDLPRAVIPDFHELHGEGAVDAAILAQLPSEPFVMFVGALRRIKGVQELLDSYGLLTSPPPLVLIGTRAPDSPDRYPPGVRVLYDLPNATVMEAWRHAMFGVAPSILPEPLGNVIHEAMSAGRPVIGTRPGGHSDIIEHGQNGLLVPAGDVRALREAMQRLIDDRSLRKRLGEHALVTAARFTPAPALERFEALYRDTIHAAEAGTVRRRRRGRRQLGGL